MILVVIILPLPHITVKTLHSARTGVESFFQLGPIITLDDTIFQAFERVVNPNKYPFSFPIDCLKQSSKLTVVDGLQVMHFLENDQEIIDVEPDICSSKVLQL